MLKIIGTRDVRPHRAAIASVYAELKKYMERHKFMAQLAAMPWASDASIATASMLLDDFDAEKCDALLFRRVKCHVDDWGKIYRNGRWLAPAFVHLVLMGKCEIRAGRERIKVQRGDVFVMNPNRPHEVVTETLCMTATGTITMKEARAFPNALKSACVAGNMGHNRAIATRNQGERNELDSRPGPPSE